MWDTSMCDCFEHIVHLLTVADHKTEELIASKEQLQAELEASKRTSQARSQKFLMLEEELKAKQKGMAFLTDQFEQLKQQGEDRVSIAISIRDER